MKSVTSQSKKLNVKRETVRSLDVLALKFAVGGKPVATTISCEFHAC